MNRTAFSAELGGRLYTFDKADSALEYSAGRDAFSFLDMVDGGRVSKVPSLSMRVCEMGVTDLLPL